MKTAIVVGGSNGIGLAIAESLIKKNYHVNIIDICEPDKAVLSSRDSYTYYYCDLLQFDDELFEKLKKDISAEVLMITAGFGRVSDFEYIHTSEINKIISVNTIATLKIIRCFYDRIKNSKPFYCGVMGSIAGLCSSPMFSVYAASKAAVCRFVESVNIELEVAGVNNRILNVSPGSIKGTRFNGGNNDMSLIADLANEIVCHLFLSDELFIPEYGSIFKGVLERYYKDPHQYGLSSYVYKKSSERAINESRVKIGYLSGTFDLFHIGHLNLLKRAKAQCDYLIVGVHPDATHKGKETFIPFEERKAIVSSIKFVDKVVKSCAEDCDAWNLWHYNMLFVGSDYKGTERFKRYEGYFKDKNVEIVYFPYTRTTSSTQIRNAILLKTNNIDYKSQK